jgi:hypothetical protein
MIPDKLIGLASDAFLAVGIVCLYLSEAPLTAPLSGCPLFRLAFTGKPGLFCVFRTKHSSSLFCVLLVLQQLATLE